MWQIDGREPDTISAKTAKSASFWAMTSTSQDPSGRTIISHGNETRHQKSNSRFRFADNHLSRALYNVWPPKHAFYVRIDIFPKRPPCFHCCVRLLSLLKNGNFAAVAFHMFTPPLAQVNDFHHSEAFPGFLRGCGTPHLWYRHRQL